MKRLLSLALVGAVLGIGCGPKVDVSIVKTTVDEVDAQPSTTPPPGPERFLPEEPPRPFVLGGGPAHFEDSELLEYLQDKRTLDQDPSGWSEKVEQLVTAEYIDPGDRPLSIEIYQLADSMLAKLFGEAYFPADDEEPTPKDRAHAVVDRYVVSVIWFNGEDADLTDAGERLLASAVEAIESETEAQTDESE